MDAVPSSDGAMDHRPYCMEDIPAGEIKSGGNLCFSYWLLMSLCPHHFIAQETQLDTASGMHDVVNAGVERIETAQQLTVSGIDDCVSF